MNDTDWTASLIDRVNEFLREHPVTSQVNNGADCARAITALHGYCGSLKSRIANLEYENEQLKSILAGTESRYSKHTVTERTMLDFLVRPHMKAKNRHKRIAQARACHAVRSGKIPKRDTCESCGAKVKLHKHHPDYSKPLEVVFLCPPCHGKVHWKSCL